MNSPVISTVKSPGIIMSNADYKRPSSILSVASSSRDRRQREMEEETPPLSRNWTGTIFLSCHFFIEIVSERLD